MAVYAQIRIPAEPSSGRSPGVPPVLSRFMGAAATSSSFSFRARTDKAARLSFEISTNSDLSGSTITDEVITNPDDDFTASGAITGLTANTLYYCMPLVNGERQYSVANCPRFTTMPTPGVDTEVTLVWGSCQDNPHQATLWGSVNAEGPRAVFHLGDRHYADTTHKSTQRSKYRDCYEPGSQFVTQVVERIPLFCVPDDHDAGGNNIHGNAPGMSDSRQAFLEYTAAVSFVDSERRHVAQSGVIANVAWFMLDVRNQRASSLPRFPGAGTNTADTGSSGSTLIIRAADSPSSGSNAYKGWYVKIGTDYRRVTGSTFNSGSGTHTCALDQTVAGLGGSSTYFLKDASMLDKDHLSSNDQVSALVNWATSATERWKVIFSPVSMNKTFTSGSDVWGGWDTEQMELLYILQELAALDNLVILDGDRHSSAIDDGTNAVRPNASASPFNKLDGNLAIGGTFSNGKQESGGDMYGRATFNATQAVISIRMADGTKAPNITDLTVLAA